MPSFGLIAEGLTDHNVIKAIVEGVFGRDNADTRELVPATGSSHTHEPGQFSNWELVFDYCSSPRFKDAFPYLDYVIVHIDTDKCDDDKFGVPKYES